MRNSSQAAFCKLAALLFLSIVWLGVGPPVTAQESVRVRVAGRTLDGWQADLASSNQTIRLRAAKSIGLFGSQAIGVLQEMLTHRDDAVRYWAASHFGDLQAFPQSAKEALEGLRNDGSPGVRLAAGYALASAGEETQLAVLSEFLGHSERGMACSAAEMLGRIGPAASSALPRLESILKRHSSQRGADYHVRGAVQNAIRKIKNDNTLIQHQRPQTGGAYRTWLDKKSAPGPPPLKRTSVVSRPNILWISCEDISPNLGCYGDAYASTPNLDKLAAQGARYDRAFTPAGVCAVVRSGIISGMYPIALGSQHMRSTIVPPPGVKCFSEYLRAAGYFCTNKSKTDYQFSPPITAWDRQGNAHNDWRDRAQGQPFFSVINLTVSHESQIRHSEQVHAQILARLQPDQRHDPAKAAPHVPPIYAQTPETMKDWAWYQDNISEMDRQAGEILQRLDDDGLADETVVIFWSDHGRGLPRGKRWIYDSGVHIPIIVRWPGTVPAGTVVDELVSTQDLTPTTMAIAGLDPPSYMHGRIMCGPRSEAPPEYLFFHRDRMDEAFELMRAARDKRFKYIRNYEPEKPYAQHIDYMDKMPTLVDLRRLHAAGELRGPQLAFMLPNKPVEELYDVVNDPHETKNLAGDPMFADTLAKMRGAVESWQVSVGDQGLVPEPILMERMRPGAKMQKTAAPSLSMSSVGNRRQVALSCETAGASIAYAIGDEKFWSLYHRPFAVQPGQVVRARSIRLGFTASEPIRQIVP